MLSPCRDSEEGGHASEQLTTPSLGCSKGYGWWGRDSDVVVYRKTIFFYPEKIVKFRGAYVSCALKHGEQIHIVKTNVFSISLGISRVDVGINI